jgi:hypothetical protein
MKPEPHFLHKYRPAAHKIWLHLLAGLVWLGVGIMLAAFSSRWLQSVALSSMLLLILAGLVLAALIYSFGFSKLAQKNIRRISAYGKERVCLFAFQEWKSYPLVAFMVSLGIYLRSYSAIPKPMLAVLYLGIGGGIFSASLHYFAHILSLFKHEV